MKAKDLIEELISLLTKVNEEADVIVEDYDGNRLTISKLTNQQGVIVIDCNEVYHSYGEPDEDIKRLIKWRDELTDYWGEDLLWLVAKSLAKGDDRCPEDLKPAMKKFQTYCENKQFAIVHYVLDIKPGEGYHY